MTREPITYQERWRRRIRIIRYLWRKGSLFKRKEKPHWKKNTRRDKPRRSFRRISRVLWYLFRKGSFFKRKPRPAKVKQKKPRKYSFLYKAYRKARFIIHTGAIFRKPPPLPESVTGKVRRPKKKRSLFRRLRYLQRRGTLFRKEDEERFSTVRKGIRFFKMDHVSIMINSTSLFLISFIVLYLVYSFATAIAANSFEIKTIIFYNQIDYLIRSKDWTPDSVKIVFSSGPLVASIIGIILILVYTFMSDGKTLVKSLILWMFFQAMVMFFGEILLGSLLNMGIGYVIMYLFFEDTEKLVMILLTMGMLVFIGVLFPRMYLFSSNYYYNNLTSRNRRPFLSTHFLWPFFLGNLAILVITLPKPPFYVLYTNLTMLLIIVGVYVRTFRYQDLLFDEEPRKIRIKWGYVLTAVIFAIAYRVIFGIGVRI